MLIAKCGLDCSECNAYKAYANNDEVLRKKTAEVWSQQYGHSVKPEDINCAGCTDLKGAHIGYCAQCEVRACGIQHNIPNCASCPEYGCEKLTKFWAMAPAAKANLEALRKGR